MTRLGNALVAAAMALVALVAFQQLADREVWRGLLGLVAATWFGVASWREQRKERKA